jgi:flagellar motor switch protein FliM
MSVLSQEEIDALVNTLHDPQASAVRETRKVKNFDFRVQKRSEKFSGAQMQTIRLLHDNFTRLLNNALSLYLRASVESSIVHIEQVAFSDFISSVERSSILSIFSLDPLNGSGMLKADAFLLFAIIDRLLGGPGRRPKEIRDLTDIERTLITRFLARMFNSYREAWNYLLTMSFKIEAIDSNPQFIPRIIPMDNMVAVISCELKIGDASGTLDFCLPYTALQSLGNQLAEFQLSPSLISGNTFTASDIAVLAANLQKADVSVQVELGRINVSLHDLLTLQEGNVLLFDAQTSMPLSMYVNGCEKFQVYPGVHRDKLAVQISEIVEEMV